ncbi:MAG TPA: PAS domain S-box protein [Gammaproteobacteria bacterium]
MVESAYRSTATEAAEFKALLDAAVDAIVVIDADGSIEEFNDSAVRLFGFSRSEVVGKNVRMLMPEPDRSNHDLYLRHYRQSGEGRIIGIGREALGQRADGTTFPMHLSVGDVDGERFVGIIRDLTAEKAAKEEARSLESRLAEVGRFSLLGEMAAGLAHEINQPLSAIATYAKAGERFLAQDPVDIEGLQSSCTKISEQALRAGEIIRNLRGFVRRESPRMDELEVNQVVSDVLGLIEADARTEGIPVKTVLEKNLPRVKGQAIQLQQVLLNLTRNAVDAMRTGMRKSEGIEVRTESTGDAISVLVTDYGHGVSEHLGDDVFHPFVSTKPEGLGVGLAISKTIIRAHEGKLFHKPNPAGGTIFGFTLPVATED